MQYRGRVLWGANNIFRVLPIHGEEGTDSSDGIEARIKGKILPGAEDEYNPLAPGDVVVVSGDGASALIEARLPRDNRVVRWNRTRQAIQTVAANVDQIGVVASFREPTLRRRFVDRVLAMAQLEEIPSFVVINKSDLIKEDSHEYQRTLGEIGIDTFLCSARTGRGIDDLRKRLNGIVTVLFGQSGVGKSTLVNALYAGVHQETGQVSLRYNRGRHTTTVARQIITSGNSVVVDTPGVREFDMNAYDPVEIAAGFREFLPYIPSCTMPSCTHVHEPGCSVIAAVHAEKISSARYKSYLRVLADLGGGR